MRTYSERLALFDRSDIYPVVSSEFCNGRDVGDIIAGIAAGGAKIVQLREKNLSDCAMFALVKKCQGIIAQFDMLLIIDDRVDIAIATGADGVHLGQDDFPLKEAKNLAPEMIFGTSTHNAPEILAALEEGCSYLNIGPVFPTKTKSVACGALGLDTVESLKTLVSCPFSIMGGIKEPHLGMLYAKGFKHIAMVTEITQASDVEFKVKQLRRAMKGCCHE